MADTLNSGASRDDDPVGVDAAIPRHDGAESATTTCSIGDGNALVPILVGLAGARPVRRRCIAHHLANPAATTPSPESQRSIPPDAKNP